MTVQQLRDLLTPYDADHEIEVRSNGSFGWTAFHLDLCEVRFVKVAKKPEAS